MQSTFANHYVAKGKLYLFEWKNTNTILSKQIFMFCPNSGAKYLTMLKRFLTHHDNVY